MCCVKVGSVGSTALNICQCGFGGQVRARFWFVWVKELGTFLDDISHPKWSVPPLLIFSRDSAPLEQCGSAAPCESFITHPSLRKVTHCSLKILAKAEPGWKRGLHIVCTEARAKPMNLVYDSGTGISIIWRNLFLESWFWPTVATFLVLFLIHWWDIWTV